MTLEDQLKELRKKCVQLLDENEDIIDELYMAELLKAEYHLGNAIDIMEGKM